MYHLPKKKLKQQIKIVEIGVEQLIVFYYINCSVLQGFLPPRNVVSEHT